jgi:hypothetical protein
MKRGPCKGLCSQYVALRPSSGSRYASGQRRCQTCEIFLKPEGVEDGIICKCCHLRVRNKPRSKLAKEIFHNAVKKNIHENNSDLEEQTFTDFETTARREAREKQDQLVRESQEECKSDKKSTPIYKEKKVDGKTYHEFKNFIEKEMKLQDNYQPVMLKYLLSHKTAHKGEIAESLAHYNNKDDSDFEQVKEFLEKHVYKVLVKSGFVIEEPDFPNTTYQYYRRDKLLMYRLNGNYDEFQIMELDKLLTEKINEWNDQYGISEFNYESESNLKINWLRHPAKQFIAAEPKPEPVAEPEPVLGVIGEAIKKSMKAERAAQPEPKPEPVDLKVMEDRLSREAASAARWAVAEPELEPLSILEKQWSESVESRKQAVGKLEQQRDLVEPIDKGSSSIPARLAREAASALVGELKEFGVIAKPGDIQEFTDMANNEIQTSLGVPFGDRWRDLKEEKINKIKEELERLQAKLNAELKQRTLKLTTKQKKRIQNGTEYGLSKSRIAKDVLGSESPANVLIIKQYLLSLRTKPSVKEGHDLTIPLIQAGHKIRSCPICKKKVCTTLSKGKKGLFRLGHRLKSCPICKKKVCSRLSKGHKPRSCPICKKKVCTTLSKLQPREITMTKNGKLKWSKK